MSAGQDRTDQAGLEELDAAYLTTVLRGSGALGPEHSVVSVRAVPLGADRSMMSAVYRLHLGYAGPCTAEGSGPATVIAKVACAEPTRRGVADRFSFYEREVFFYERIAASIPLQTPVCHQARAAGATQDLLLILEDMGDAARTQTEGCSLEQVLLVADELARLHAHWWGRAQELAADVHSMDSQDYLENVCNIFAAAWPDCVRLAGDRMPPELLALGGRWTHVVGVLAPLLATPETLCHGDFRSDNVIFGDRGLVAFDFQLLVRGNGVVDLAYFISQSVPTLVRSGRDAEFLDRYLAALGRHGVHYDRESAYRAYRAAALYTLLFPVVLYHTFDELPPAGQMLTATMLDRAVATITELNAWDLVAGG